MQLCTYLALTQHWTFFPGASRVTRCLAAFMGAVKRRDSRNMLLVAAANHSDIFRQKRATAMKNDCVHNTGQGIAEHLSEEGHGGHGRSQRGHRLLNARVVGAPHGIALRRRCSVGCLHITSLSPQVLTQLPEIAKPLMWLYFPITSLPLPCTVRCRSLQRTVQV